MKSLVALGLISWIFMCNLVQINCNEHNLNLRTSGLRRRWPFLFSVDPNDITFYLYPNPENEDYREKIDISNTTALAFTSYNTSRPLVILIHGLMGSPSTITDVINIKNAYLSVKYEANIVMVDHHELQDAHFSSRVRHPLADSIASLPALLNTFKVGNKVADFIKFLLNDKAVRGPEDVHIIGFGNGGCIAGHAGDTIQKNLPGGQKIGRISGLDILPGGSLVPSYMLDASDATFVDITYTAYGLFGIVGRTGHVDFYINGGRPSQPNCRHIYPFTEPYCSHISSVYYFAKSIRNKNNMVACKCTHNCAKAPVDCNEKVQYGQFTSLSARGDYFVAVKNYE